jgi:hypothetical protein
MKKRQINNDQIKNESSKLGISYHRILLKINDKEEYFSSFQSILNK